MGQVGPGDRTQPTGQGKLGPALVWEGTPDSGIFCSVGQAASSSPAC